MQIISQMPVAIDHLNVNPKHMVINLMIPHVIIQLSPQHIAKITMTTIAATPPVANFLLKLFIFSSPFVSLTYNNPCSSQNFFIILAVISPIISRTYSTVIPASMRSI